MMDEEVTKEFLARTIPDSLLIDHPEISDEEESHDVDPESKNPNFKFLNKCIDPNLEENKDFIYVSHNMFKIIKKLIKRTEEVKRVVFQYNFNSMIQVEKNFVYMPVLFLIKKKKKK